MITVGVVGLGTMGLGIAQVFLAAGHRVIATDSHTATRQSAKDRLTRALDKRVAAGKIATEKRHADLSHFTVCEGLEGLRPCELVVEAIAENIDAKRALFDAAQVVFGFLERQHDLRGIVEFPRGLVQ